MRRIALGAVALVTLNAVSAAAQQRGKSHNYIYFEPTSAACAAGTTSAEVKKVKIDSHFYTSGMISPDSAKAIAMCYVPGQVSSGEMESNGNRTVYVVTVLPTDKKTYSKVIIDANTGAVLSTKQFGGARGLAGFLRESQKRKHNKVG